MPYKRINKMGETRAVRIACGHIREIIGGNMGAMGRRGGGGLYAAAAAAKEQFQLGRRRKKKKNEELAVLCCWEINCTGDQFN